jgi:hypothetical protein
MRRPAYLRGAVLVFCGLLPPGMASGQESRSAKPAVELSQLLSERKLSTVAAAVPGESNRFVAASLVPGFGLLVISARTPAAAFLADCIKREAYQDAYSYLNGTSLPEGKFFVQDTGANGLHVRPPGETSSFDVTYENVTKQLMFDGDAKEQHMTDAQYRAAADAADARYAKLLELLIAQLKGRAQAAPARQ